jgi:hypothetical protein
MGDTYRTPEGEVYDEDDLERGRTCGRCGTFIEVRADLPPKPEDMDYADLRVADYAGTESRVMGDGLSADLCPECREELERWFENTGYVVEETDEEDEE